MWLLASFQNLPITEQMLFQLSYERLVCSFKVHGDNQTLDSFEVIAKVNLEQQEEYFFNTVWSRRSNERRLEELEI